MNSADDSPPIGVTIFGDRYRIRTDRGDAHTRACAKYVDDAIQRAHMTGVAEPHRAAILAALEITDELLQARGEIEQLTAAVEARVTGVTERLESLGGHTAP
ncbi:cell division protein ZapA [Candidatus Palauibacter soopunensis]|uniref:cell division protein ZapA n=1 Tax=Candidatus Palauibacter soopunensis TaxID=3056739 RepID=UPI0023892093|nr:cell division protein ZapA [Candidatus Palauibacter soopunensis]MDE2880032.1 cell division protein ZapA [Candidatus Palauibacter soopunensis]